MRVLMSLGHKNLILLLGMHSYNEHEKMPKWGIFNASVLLNEHGHLLFSAECTIGMVWGLTALKHYGNKALWH